MIRKRNQLSGGAATRALMLRNGGLCADCGIAPRITRYKSAYCRDCMRRRANAYNRKRKIQSKGRAGAMGGHVINPKVADFWCEKCGQPVERAMLNKHWRQCVQSKAR